MRGSVLRRSGRVKVMGILNVSPESFYRGSVRVSTSGIAATARRFESDGADIIDIGGMSTAPYLSTMIPPEKEAERVCRAVDIVSGASDLPISVDTCRSAVARAALEEGAEIINDVTGLQYDSGMADAVADSGASVIISAHSAASVPDGSMRTVNRLIKKSLGLARAAGIPRSRIAIDPAIGFFRRTGKNPFFTRTRTDWTARDLSVLGGLLQIRPRLPVVASASRKSFLGRILGSGPGDRLAGSLAAEIASVINGASIVRTHNVGQTRRVLDALHKSL